MTESGEQGQALDLLQRLGELDMNLTILTQTRIGMTVNALRKSSSNDEVISQSKGLIKAWKKFVPDNNSDKKEKSSSQETNGKNNSQSGEKNSSSDKKTSEKNFVQQKASATTDDVRLGCRRLLATALRGVYIQKDLGPFPISSTLRDLSIRSFFSVKLQNQNVL